MNGAIHVIGCGGVGSWLIPSLAKLVPHTIIAVHDGDKLEERNLDRQLFTTQDIGKNKAEALVFGLNNPRVGAKPSYYQFGMTDHSPDDVIFCCADNNAARLASLQAVDYYGCRAIIAANEIHSAEAYYYCPDYKDTPCDPRHYYPEILKDDGNDPLRPACTGEYQVAQPQLVSANFMAAALAQHVFVANVMELPKLDAEARLHVPYQLINNLTGMFANKPAKVLSQTKGTNEPKEEEVRL